MNQLRDECIGLGPNCEYRRIGSFLVGIVFFFFFFNRRESIPGAETFPLSPFAAPLASASDPLSFRSSPRFLSI